MVLSSDGLVFKSPLSTEGDRITCSFFIITLICGTMVLMLWTLARRVWNTSIEDTIQVNQFEIEERTLEGKWHIITPILSSNPKHVRFLTIRLETPKAGGFPHQPQEIMIQTVGASTPTHPGDTIALPRVKMNSVSGTASNF
jgi:hypothetical protein